MIQFLWMLLCLTGKGTLVEGKHALVVLNAILGEEVTFPAVITDLDTFFEISWCFKTTSIASLYQGQKFIVRVKNFKGRLNVLYQKGSLHISNLTMEDQGVYTAVITDEKDTTENTEKNYTVKIFPRVSKPHIMATADNVNGTCNITLNCTAEGGDNVNYTWSGGNINQSVGSILDLSWTNSSRHLTVNCTATNPVSHRSESVKPWESCNKKDINTSTGGSNTEVIIGIVCFLILFLVLCAVYWKSKKKLKESRDEGQTTYSQINSPSNTTQGNNHYTRSEETKQVTTVYATVNTRKRESPSIDDYTERTMYTVVQTPKKGAPAAIISAMDEKTVYSEVQQPKNGAPAAIISAMDEKTVYSEVQQPKNKSDNTILYETVSNEPSQATSYNEVI